MVLMSLYVANISTGQKFSSCGVFDICSIQMKNGSIKNLNFLTKEVPHELINFVYFSFFVLFVLLFLNWGWYKSMIFGVTPFLY